MGWRIVRRWGREEGVMRRDMRRLLRGRIRRLDVFGWGVMLMGGCGLVILRGGRGRRLVGRGRGAVRGIGGFV